MNEWIYVFIQDECEKVTKKKKKKSRLTSYDEQIDIDRGPQISLNPNT